MRARRLLLAVAGLLFPLLASAQIVEYYTLDAIGNVRVVTDQQGKVIERHDYLPFGEECTTGPCASNPGFGAGQARRFTGKERDTESGLDYFGARYYGSKIGRFTTTDPVTTIQENLVDPQRWNKYAYARDNLLRYIDPDGRATLPARPGVYATNKWIRSQIDRVMQWDPLPHDHIVASLVKGMLPTNAKEDAQCLVAAAMGAVIPLEVSPSGLAAELSFDQARRLAFERAGMTDAAEVTFTKVDPATGTVVEFKGPGGAKVAYDGPHPGTPGAGHDTPHVGWQSAGKRGAGGAERGNIAYSGPQHPSRSPVKGENVVEPH